MWAPAELCRSHTCMDRYQTESYGDQRVHLAATRESSLFLFHALGKVLFNKRKGYVCCENARS